ncbi:hypothetical protein BASA81_015400 [Batrachochytrium salamandrivorans]|nr:hypothetical protein BASA81_015400 [Batrachochytrium salamandrivorans]
MTSYVCTYFNKHKRPLRTKLTQEFCDRYPWVTLLQATYGSDPFDIQSDNSVHYRLNDEKGFIDYLLINHFLKTYGCHNLVIVDSDLVLEDDFRSKMEKALETNDFVHGFDKSYELIDGQQVLMSADDFAAAFRNIAVLPADQQAPIQGLLIKAVQLSSVEKQLEDKGKQLEDKDKQLADLKADKDQMIALLTEGKVRAEAELLMAQAKISSVYAFRPIIELSCSKWNKNSSELGASVAKYLAKFVQPGKFDDSPGLFLSEDSQKVLKSLDVVEGNLQREIALNVTQLYSKLCKPFHQPPPDVIHPHGFLLGGDPPLRYATALVVLKLQKTPGNDGFPKKVFLLGDDDKPTHVLLNGSVAVFDPRKTY